MTVQPCHLGADLDERLPEGKKEEEVTSLRLGNRDRALRNFETLDAPEGI